MLPDMYQRRAMNKLKKVNILGKIYTIEYVKELHEVDINGREQCFGQIDYVTKSIRVYDRDRANDDIVEVLLHEIIHGICSEMLIQIEEKDVNTLGIVLADTLIRNKIIDVK
jgi:hypothetical protein